MASDKWQLPAILSRVQRYPKQYDFFYSVYLIRAWLARSTKMQPDIRFKNNPELSHVLHNLRRIDIKNNPILIEIETAVLQILGTNGVMPLHFTELVLEKSLGKNQAYSDFINLFFNRSIHGLYAQWERTKFPILYNYQRHHIKPNPVESICGSIAGGVKDQVFPKFSQYYFTAMLSRPWQSAESLSSILSFVFQMPIRIKEHAKSWLNMDKEHYAYLGKNTPLSQCILGTRMQDCKHKIGIHIGPISYTKYLRLLPNTTMNRRLKKLINLLVKHVYDFDITVKVFKSDVPKSQFNNQFYLGWNTWLNPGNTHDQSYYTLTLKV